jgi:hypothetical protein
LTTARTSWNNFPTSFSITYASSSSAPLLDSDPPI